MRKCESIKTLKKEIQKIYKNRELQKMSEFERYRAAIGIRPTAMAISDFLWPAKILRIRLKYFSLK